MGKLIGKNPYIVEEDIELRNGNKFKVSVVLNPLFEKELIDYLDQHPEIEIGDALGS